MATKKKTKKKTSHRRVGKSMLNVNSPILPLVAGVIGAMLSPKLNDKIETDVLKGKVDGKIIGFAEGGLGAALIFMKIGKKKTVAQVAAGGFMAGMGVRKLLSEFGIISGIGGYKEMPALGRPAPVRRINGYGMVPALGGGENFGYKAENMLGNSTPGYGYGVSSVLGKVIRASRG